MRTSAAREVRPRRQEARLEPYQVRVPDALAKEIDDLVEVVSKRLGEAPDLVRRGVEISVLSRGLETVKGEEGLR